MKEIPGELGINYYDMVGDLTRAMNEHQVYFNMVRQEILNIMNDEPIIETIVDIKTFKFLK